MHNAESRRATLFTKYYNKTASVDEIDELFKLLEVTSEEELIEILRSKWEQPEAENHSITAEENKEVFSKILQSAKEQELRGHLGIRSSPWLKFTAAAAVLILVSWFVFFSEPISPTTSKSTQKAAVKNDLLPGGNKAVLKTSDGSSLILNDAKNGILAQQGGIEVNKTKDGQLVFASKKDPSQNQSVVFNTLETPNGGQYHLILSDGTKVWLNAASSLRFPSTFIGKERVVELKGEAYFEVAKNARMPFKVKARNTEIQVLGTHFNVMSYDDELSMKTTLVEGAIRVKNGDRTDDLHPGQQAVGSQNGKLEVRDNVNVEEEIAWKKGLFQFNDTNLKEVMRQLSRWYDVKVVYEKEVPENRITGKISRNVKASEVINMLRFMGTDCRIEGKNIIVNK